MGKSRPWQYRRDSGPRGDIIYIFQTELLDTWHLERTKKQFYTWNVDCLGKSRVCESFISDQQILIGPLTWVRSCAERWHLEMFTCSVSTNVCCNLLLRLRFCLFLSFVSTCFIHFDAVFVACSFRTGIETTMKCYIFSSFFAFWSSLCQVLHFLLVSVGGRMGSVLFLSFTVGLSISFYLRCIFQVACN